MSRLSNGATEKEVAKVTRTSLFISLIMLAMMTVFGRPLILILYGNEFKQAYEILVIMMTGVIGMVFYKMVYAYNVVQGRRVVNLLFLGVAAITNIIGNYFLIPVGGVLAAAGVSVISYIVCGFCFLIYFHRKTKISYLDILFIKKKDFKTLTAFLKAKDKT